MAAGANRRILIAGAGIGGLCAAIAARSAGWEVEVHERAGDPQQESGTAFNLWGNAVTALDRIGLGDAVRDTGDRIESMRLLDHRGRVLAENPIGRIGAELGTTSVNIRRSDLVHLLFAACKDADIPVHHGSAAIGYQVDGHEVVLELEHGDRARGVALVGADGARSAIRGRLTHESEPVASSLPVRGISQVDAEVPPNTVLMSWGPRGGGVGCWPLGDGQVSWTVGTNSRLRQRFDRGDDPRQAVLEFLTGFPRLFHRLVWTTPAERIVISPVLVRPRADIWGDGPVTLIGDAAHAMPTVFAQGACQALEDAVVLGEQLSAADDPVDALRAYELRRRPRVDWLRKRVFMMDKLQKVESQLLCTVRNTMTRKAPPEKAETSWRQMMTFGFAPEAAR